MRACVVGARRRDEPLVLVPVVEIHRPRAALDESNGARHPIDDVPFDGFLQHRAQHSEHVVDGLRSSVRQRQLQSLHLLIRDCVKTLVAQRRHQMPLQDGLGGGDTARLLAVRPRVTVNESRRKLRECGHLLWRSDTVS